VQKYIDKGPIDNFRKFLLSSKSATEAELDLLDQQVEKEIEAAVKFAQESPEPPDEALFEHIYVETEGGA
jgi:pyruvate dehydrogenase E1 component alpha subunit